MGGEREGVTSVKGSLHHMTHPMKERSHVSMNSSSMLSTKRE